MSSLQELFLKDLEDLDCAETSGLNNKDNISENTRYSDTELINKISNLNEQIFGNIEKSSIIDPNLNNRLLDTDDKIYNVFQEIIDMIGMIDSKISEKYEHVKALYKDYFSELSSIIINKTDYLEVVKRIISHEKFEDVKLNDILPNSTIMTITISSNTNKRNTPTLEKKKSIIECINFVNQINGSKSKILMFLQSQIEAIAPNLSALVGPEIAANLLCISGGLKNLAEMPSQNIMILGSLKNNKKNGHFSTGPVRLELLQSIVSQSDIVRNVPDKYKKKAIRLVSLKCGLCARIDLTSAEKIPDHGINYRSYILDILEKAQEPPQKPMKKPLPIPKDFPKSRRGGKRIRKIKEKFKQTKIRKEMNRMKFGEEEEEYTVDGKTIGLGLLSAGSGRRIRGLQVGSLRNPNSNSKSGVLSGGDSKLGNSSSISFTPYQGMIF
ncbi:pre-mRNA splicing protein [Cryptosporidium ubiquitum]|uniref:Pre-mRNA splicing protein n=1 Tax=Cryptosporidium ubiquitum TaxID=857276 RepID=A0A1J4MG01_9CRYT|nr:pre-mRNA splicing protein [Cryptosporidium ubiquitum]OII72379.1 pre-mRNA splicing protein [Cryptosporidium ubiquitum]